MVLTPSSMVAIGTDAPDFELPTPSGDLWGRDSFAGKPMLVMFICNHCPYVKNIADVLATRTADWMEQGVAVIGINSNDVANYPEDSPAKMTEEIARRDYRFPYVFDETQEVARDYQAACTPDFFLYDADHRLVYRGRFDASTPGNGEPVTGDELDAAVQATLAGEPVADQIPSLGCNVKWK